jgi:hypothetical protein
MCATKIADLDLVAAPDKPRVLHGMLLRFEKSSTRLDIDCSDATSQFVTEEPGSGWRRARGVEGI